MTRRTRFILVAVAVALVALGVAAYLTLRPSAAPPAPVQQPSATAPLAPAAALPSSPSVPTPTTTAPATPTFTRASERDILVQQLTASGGQFAERFGSYSNQGNFQNLTDLYPLMTDAMRQTVERTIAAAGAAPTGYVGVTTRAVSTRLVSLDEKAGSATVRVSTQRVTQTGDAAPTTSYADLTIIFRKVQNVWLVDSALWPAS